MITRYYISIGYTPWGADTYIDEDDQGDWVKYEDMERLILENEMLKEELKRLYERSNTIQQYQDNFPKCKLR